MASPPHPNPPLSPHSHHPGEEQRFPIAPSQQHPPTPSLPPNPAAPAWDEGSQLPPYHSTPLKPLPVSPIPLSQSRTEVPKTPPLFPPSPTLPEQNSSSPGGGTYLWGWHWGFVGCWICTRLIKPALPHLHISHLHCTAGRGP